MPLPSQQSFRHHICPEWLRTPNGDPRGYIQPRQLKELWFHTGTICNLSCPFCLEGSKPGDDRLNKMTFNDVKPWIDEAVSLGVEGFSFTGGEPFVTKDIVKILDYALDFCPCLVLTNATAPLDMRIDELRPLKNKKNLLNFRVSIDYSDRQKHEAGRGKGTFDLSWRVMGQLHRQGFSVSIARQREKERRTEDVERAYRVLFQKAGLPADTRIVSFPDFFKPGSMADVPHITEDCMTRYHTQEGRDQFMCVFSKMVVKKDGHTRVYACTLVDDDPDYDLGASLTEASDVRVMLKHHRCYSCFAQGASCSEI